MESVKGVVNSNILKQTQTQKTNNIDFKELLIDSLEKVNQDQLYAEKMDEALITGKIDNIEDVMIAAEKAELSLTFAVEIRNKILDAYNEIMRMQM